MSHPTRLVLSTCAVAASLGLALSSCTTAKKSAESAAPTVTALSSSEASSAAGSSPSTPGTTSQPAPASESTSSQPSSSESPSSAPGSALASALPASCAATSLATKSKGKLTIATDKPVYEPWFVADKPESGKGFEGAVAAAVASKLGFNKDAVKWIRVPFDSVIKPGDLAFDFDINEFSITADRKKAVDFSSGYYDVTQAIIALNANKVSGATTIADLAAAKIGGQIGTTSLTAVKDIVKPKKQVAVYNTNDDAVKALQNGQIDALVADLPTALYMTSAQIQKSKIIGQFANQGGTPEQFGLVLQKGSPLTDCVSQAVDALRADGTLAKLQDQWLTAGAGAPVLK